MKEGIPEPTDDAHAPESFDEAIPASTASDAELSFASPAVARPALMSMSRLCILAVQDESGYLIPVFTGRDLLFELKTIWQRQN
jgi:hypothetical protein